MFEVSFKFHADNLWNMANNNADRLYEIGFQVLGEWVQEGDGLSYQLIPDDANARARLKAGAALYAFVCEESVLYVGKTSMTIAQRFGGYKKPGNRQSTNIKCNNGILDCIKRNKCVEILTMSGVSQLRWGEFELNIAAGLEDSLIAEFQPPWNGRSGKVVSESETIEREALHLDESPVSTPGVERVGKRIFRIKLGETYYNDGFFNPGVEVSSLLGRDRETMLIRLGEDDLRGIETVINRTANPSTGSPRLYGRKQTAKWFQKHYKLGDVVEAIIVGPNEIVLTLPRCRV